MCNGMVVAEISLVVEVMCSDKVGVVTSPVVVVKCNGMVVVEISLVVVVKCNGKVGVEI